MWGVFEVPSNLLLSCYSEAAGYLPNWSRPPAVIFLKLLELANIYKEMQLNSPSPGNTT